MVKIKFGTAGWRGEIAKDFTFENIEIVAQAISNYVIQQGLADKGLVIGYDNRFLSPETGKLCASVFAGNGIKVFMTDVATPTPVVAFSIIHFKAAGGIVITASHNPPTHNGIKYNGIHGQISNNDVTDIIEKLISEIQQNPNIKKTDDKTLIQHINPKQEYITTLLKLIDTEAIKKSKLKVVVSPRFGAGIGYTDEILKNLGCQVATINGYRDVLFGGKTPDISGDNISDLVEEVKKSGADLGLAMDGDADRFAIVDKGGITVSANQTLYLLMHYLMKTRGWRSCISKTITTTNMLNRLAEKYGVKLLETPVGFKYTAEGILFEDAFLGAEESGGMSIKGHVPEKDGIIAGLLVTEMVSKTGKTLTELMEDLKAEVGYLYSGRLDIQCTQKDKDRILEFLTTYKPEQIVGKKMVNRIDKDGVKLIMEDGSWGLVRPSGNELVFRIYAEGNSKEQVDNILNEILETMKFENAIVKRGV